MLSRSLKTHQGIQGAIDTPPINVSWLEVPIQSQPIRLLCAVANVSVPVQNVYIGTYYISRGCARLTKQRAALRRQRVLYNFLVTYQIPLQSRYRGTYTNYRQPVYHVRASGYLSPVQSIIPCYCYCYSLPLLHS